MHPRAYEELAQDLDPDALTSDDAVAAVAPQVPHQVRLNIKTGQPKPHSGGGTGSLVQHRATKPDPAQIKPTPTRKRRRDKSEPPSEDDLPSTQTDDIASLNPTKGDYRSPQTPPSPTRGPASKVPKVPFDYDNHCAVSGADGLPCSRSISCKTHAIKLKREVQGRTRDFDMLLKFHKQRVKERKGEIRASASSTLSPARISPCARFAAVPASAPATITTTNSSNGSGNGSKKNNVFPARSKTKTKIESGPPSLLVVPPRRVNPDACPETVLDNPNELEDLPPEQESQAVIEGFKRLQPTPLAIAPGHWIEERPLYGMLEVVREALRLAK